MLYSALMLALFACNVNAHGKQVIDAPPIGSHPTKFTHFTLLAGVAGARAADWASTSQAMRQSGFREGELPKALAASKPGLTGFEFGAFAMETYLLKRLIHRDPKLTILGDAISFSSIALTDIHNYRSLAARNH